MAKKPSNNTNAPQTMTAKAVREAGPQYPVRDVMYVYDNCSAFTILEAAQFIAAEGIKVPGVPGPTYASKEERAYKYRRNKAICLVGESGVAKSVICEAIAKVNGWGYYNLNMAGLELGDVLGMATAKEDPENPGRFLQLSRLPIFEQPCREGEITPDKAMRLDELIADNQEKFDAWEKQHPGKHNPFKLKLEHLQTERAKPITPPDTPMLCLIDEAMGVDANQQKQVRQLISDRGINGQLVRDNVIFVLASNPPTAAYFTNRRFDGSLTNRVVYIPVEEDEEDMLDFLEHGHAASMGENCTYRLPNNGVGSPVEVTPDGKTHNRLHQFLVLSKLNGNHHRRACTRRRWTALSDWLIRQESMGISEKLILRFLSLALPEEVVTDFTEMLAKGNDPLNWPITGHKLLGATAEDHKEHMRLLRKWEEDPDRNLLIGCTVYLLRSALKGRKTLEKKEAANLKDVMLAVDDDKTITLLEGFSGELQDQVWELIWGTPKEKCLQGLIDRIEGRNKPVTNKK